MKTKTETKPAGTQAYPWRLFALLSIVGIAAAISILPYLLTLLGQNGTPLPVALPQIVLEQIVQSAIILLPAVGIGLLLSRRVGLDSPYLRALVYGHRIPSGFVQTAAMSLGLGFIISTVVAIVDLSLIRDEVLSNINQVNAIPVAWRFLTAFYGGIDEEILMRLFLMTMVAWIAWKIKKTPAGTATNGGMWCAIVVSTFIFGLSHLPLSSQLTDIDTAVVLRALILNGVAGIVYGWLYWKRGFEAAMMSHFASDITLQIIVPATLTALASK